MCLVNILCVCLNCIKFSYFVGLSLTFMTIHYCTRPSIFVCLNSFSCVEIVSDSLFCYFFIIRFFEVFNLYISMFRSLGLLGFLCKVPFCPAVEPVIAGEVKSSLLYLMNHIVFCILFIDYVMLVLCR